ncbi:hypothetical protein [Streptomyces sp. PAM3C]|uniref:hypothetical protein n=1 Tax=Streptomyces sp. PAM3C TaxID=2847300 RepID=UPI001C1E7345|nr:hypothetical protein [Streptomyces sp. PAM3C]MBU5943276.1 hypothetical protein [Streptomyces sp. PAM3C]
MPRKRIVQQRLLEALDAPTGPSGLGLRVVSTTSRGREVLQYVDPAAYRCSRLAAQLADEWVEYVASTSLTAGPSDSYRRSIEKLCERADAETDAELMTLESPELKSVLSKWERNLPADFTTGSQWPAMLASAMHVLIVRRDDHRHRSVDEGLARLVRGPILIGWGESNERDEFKLAEKQAMVRAAWASANALQKRLKEGWALAGQGQHPDQGSWFNIADLLWILSQNTVHPKEITRALPPASQWPEDLRALITRPDGHVYSCMAKIMLVRRLLGCLYPTTLDLHAFRVLLMDATGHASEEVTDFGPGDVEFLPKGVRLTLIKERASRLRHRAFRDAAQPQPKPGERGEHESHDKPRREASAIVRRLLEVTEKVRERTPHITDTLFVRAVLHANLEIEFCRWDPEVPSMAFGKWLDSVGVTIEGDRHIGRLRKSTKVEKAIVSGGRISEAADDHLEETFAGHYAQGTTLRVISGEVITTAQDHWFSKATGGPTVITPDAAGAAEDSEALQALGLQPEEADGIVQGQLDMGISHCKNPYDGPYSPPGELCAVAPLRCLECRNAWVMPSQLPQLLHFELHLERVKQRLTPQAFTKQWGQSYMNLKAVLADRSDEEIALARKHIEAGEATLDLPLSARVEFDS